MEYVKLGNLSEFIMGQAPNSEYCNKNNEGIPFVKAGQFGVKYPVINEWTTTPLKMASKEDVLICVVGATAGKINLGYDCSIGRSVSAIRCDKQKINNIYLYYYLMTWVTRIRQQSQGSAIGVITKDMLYDIDIPLINLDKQAKLVEILEKAQELINKRKEQLEALDELVKSRFIEMFGDPITNSKGWEVKLLGEVCDMKAGKNIKACDISEINTGTLYPCYGGNGLRGYVKEYSHEGNIPIIGRQGALCGNVKYAQGKFYATEHAVVTQPRVEMNNYWLYFLLNKLDLNRLSTGAAQPGLTVGKLNLVEIPIAPLDMQNEFEKLANQVDKLKFEVQKSLNEMENNFNALMQRAFSGKLFN